MVSGPTPTINGSQLTWTLPSLTAGQTGSLSFVASLSGAVAGTILTNTGSIAFSGVDVVSTNNIDTAIIDLLPTPPSLHIQKTLTTPGSYMSGSQYIFSIVVTNTGGSAATGLVLNDILP